ncbi:MAG: Hpt domain-containing protein [Acidobacteriota bacterium]|nr:Hpt domain-containing protein [Acidobacteriota bacterium]
MGVAASSILNLEELLNRVDEDRELLMELFFIFRSGCPTNLQRLREAVQFEDGKKVELEAHLLKGMLLNLSASRAAAAAAELEQQGRERQFSGMKVALAELQSEVELLLSQIDKRVGEFQP